jgi:hypothetical protein
MPDRGGPICSSFHERSGPARDGSLPGRDKMKNNRNDIYALRTLEFVERLQALRKYDENLRPHP